ncbi:hypothetical protein RB195_001753 [Necator americanus]|uniref:SCP domain-containing protein n=1 Tax=Necator americanus TaxID=51031 RepID=A0ABR1DGX7_NECAM
MKFKCRLCTRCVEPFLICDCETWASRSKDLKVQQIAQLRMMKRMPGVTLLMHRTNMWLENTAKLSDIRARAIEGKWTWARKMCVAKHNRWMKANDARGFGSDNLADQKQDGDTGSYWSLDEHGCEPPQLM